MKDKIKLNNLKKNKFCFNKNISSLFLNFSLLTINNNFRNNNNNIINYLVDYLDYLDIGYNLTRFIHTRRIIL